MSKIQLVSPNSYTKNLHLKTRTTKSILTSKIVTKTRSAANFPAKYDLRTLNKVSPVKNQGDGECCWTFSAMGSLESCLLTGEKWSFSENNMKNLCSELYPEGFDRTFSGGGTDQMAVAYLARYGGPVTSTMDPYNPKSGKSPAGLKPVKHFQDCVILYRSNKGPLNNSDIKSALMKYGAISTGVRGEALYEDSEYFNTKYNSSYYPQQRDPRENVTNHAICIVGWDDTFSKDKFKVKPPGNGAYIVKNSWGTDYADDGFCYVSYYDCVLSCTDGFVYMGGQPTTNYSGIYQYDPFGMVEQYSTGAETSWFSNVFKTTSKTKLSAVSFYSTDDVTSYEAFIYQDPDEDNPTSGTLAKKISGTINFMGYKTVSLGGTVALDDDQTFSVVIKIKNDAGSTIAYEYPQPRYSSKARASANQSYISANGKKWVDFTTKVKNGNVCLKAFSV
jgi:C1A family cysteine protease